MRDFVIRLASMKLAELKFDVVVKEKWVDVNTGKPCGRKKGEKRGYPACRPKNRVSSKTPKTVGEMTASEKARFKREKTSSKKITYQHRRKKKKK